MIFKSLFNDLEHIRQLSSKRYISVATHVHISGDQQSAIPIMAVGGSRRNCPINFHAIMKRSSLKTVLG